MADMTFNGASGAASGHGLFSRARIWLHNRAEYRRTLNELRSLDQRTLDDLGIAPADVDAIARGRLVRR